MTDAETVHAVPPGVEALTPCCRRSPFELPRYHRMTADPNLVTCLFRDGRSTSCSMCWFGEHHHPPSPDCLCCERHDGDCWGECCTT